MKKNLLAVGCYFLWFFCVACFLYFVFFNIPTREKIPPYTYHSHPIHRPHLRKRPHIKKGQLHCRTGKGFGQMIYDERCLSCKKNEKILQAPKGKGIYCCPDSANSLAWNGEAYQCCENGLVATVIPERSDSICCPKGTKRAFWIKEKGNLFYTCSEET